MKLARYVILLLALAIPALALAGGGNRASCCQPGAACCHEGCPLCHHR